MNQEKTDGLGYPGTDNSLEYLTERVKMLEEVVQHFMEVILSVAPEQVTNHFDQYIGGINDRLTQLDKRHPAVRLVVSH